MVEFFDFKVYEVDKNTNLTIILLSRVLFIAKFASDISKVKLVAYNETMAENFTVYPCDNKQLAFATLDGSANNARTYRLMGYQNTDLVFA